MTITCVCLAKKRGLLLSGISFFFNLIAISHYEPCCRDERPSLHIGDYWLHTDARRSVDDAIQILSGPAQFGGEFRLRSSCQRIDQQFNAILYRCHKKKSCVSSQQIYTFLFKSNSSTTLLSQEFTKIIDKQISHFSHWRLSFLSSL